MIATSPTTTETNVCAHILTTTIKTSHDVRSLSEVLDNNDAVLRWSVDLHDWEKVLKVVSTNELRLDQILHFLSLKGFEGKELMH